MRRGNTIIYDKKSDKTIWGRKGMQKFFDISLDWLDSNERAMHKRSQHSDEHAALRETIIGPIEEAFRNGYSVQVLKTNKANGENCQISFSKFLGCWLICSKNVCMPCKDERDIKN